MRTQAEAKISGVTAAGDGPASANAVIATASSTSSPNGTRWRRDP
ncbi:hypothetical protein [Cryobacterium sp.]|nr:hypothetical protein [Cryobacterium sp.]